MEKWCQVKGEGSHSPLLSGAALVDANKCWIKGYGLYYFMVKFRGKKAEKKMETIKISQKYPFLSSISKTQPTTYIYIIDRFK